MTTNERRATKYNALAHNDASWCKRRSFVLLAVHRAGRLQRAMKIKVL